jgi:hypothetical protein
VGQLIVAIRKGWKTSEARRILWGMTGQLFYCPAKGCIAGYGLTFRENAPEEPPKCVECGQPFQATSDGKWLHYQLAGPVVLFAPDASV